MLLDWDALLLLSEYGRLVVQMPRMGSWSCARNHQARHGGVELGILGPAPAKQQPTVILVLLASLPVGKLRQLVDGEVRLESRKRHLDYSFS